MWKFHQLRGRHVSLENDCTTAKRLNGSGCGICFTNTPLVNGEVFEIQVDNTGAKLKSAVSLGVTPHIPPNPTEIRSGVFITGVRMLHGPRVWENKNGGIFRPYSLKSHDLQVGDKLGMMKAPDSTLHFYLNGNDHGIGFSNLPEVVFGVVDVYGSGSEVSIINQESATESGAQAAIKKAPNFSGRPAEWNVQTVCDFIESIPECVPYVAKFQLERINGAALLELDKKDLKDFFEMPLGLAVNVCSHLKKYEEKNK